MASRGEKILEISLVKSYPRQVTWQVWLPITPVKLTTTVTSGIISSTLFVSKNSIASFATRFGSTFVEYRMVKAKITGRMFSSNNPGVLQMWYDEKVASGPTSAEATERYIISCNASAVDKRPSLKWTASDPLDLQYVAIGTAITLCTFKTYTDAATFGASVVATDYAELEGAICFQFRGLQGV